MTAPSESIIVRLASLIGAVVVIGLCIPCPAGAQEGSTPFLLDFQPKEAEIPAFEAYDVPDEEPTVTVRVETSDTLAKVPRSLYGNNINPYIGEIHREETLIDRVRALSPNILRLPGGNLSNDFFWDASPGDLPPGVPDSLVDGETGEKYAFTPWYGEGSWSMNLSGFYQFIEQTNSTPVITVNYSYARYGKTENPVQQAAHYAAEWVRHDNGRTKFWEIGNENYGSWQSGYLIDTTSNRDGQPRRIDGGVYGEHVRVFVDSMQAAADEIGTYIYIGTQVDVREPPSWDPVQRAWNRLYFEEAGDVADFFVDHNYFTDYQTDAPPSHIFNSVDRQFGEVDDYYPEQIEALGAEPKPVALTEWNIFSTGSQQMVSNVAGMHALMVLGRLAEMRNYGLAARWNVANGYDNGNDHGLFKVEDASEPPEGVPKWNPRPAYFHMYYFQQVFGDHSVRAEVEPRDGVEAYASVFSSGEAGVVVVNTTSSEQTVEIDPVDYGLGSRYYFYSLVGGTDNPPFSGRVHVNGREPDHETGGPIRDLQSIPARSASASRGVRFQAPPRSVQYVLLGHSAEPEAPSRSVLKANSPNPFASTTHIPYALEESAHVTLDVYDILGRHVTTLVDRRQHPDDYRVEWDGTADNGTAVASGVYFYRLEAGEYTQTRKLVVVR